VDPFAGMSFINKISDVSFSHRIAHGEQVDEGIGCQTDAHFEIDLPALMHLGRLLAPFQNRFLLRSPPKAAPLMKIAPNLSFTGQLETQKGGTFP
jgi:hypothetical protein